MTAVDLRTEIVQMIKSEKDKSILEAIRTLLLKLQSAGTVEDEFTEAEIAELDARRARRLSGASKGHSAEESIRLLRNAQAKDGTA